MKNAETNYNTDPTEGNFSWDPCILHSFDTKAVNQEECISRSVGQVDCNLRLPGHNRENWMKLKFGGFIEDQNRPAGQERQQEIRRKTTMKTYLIIVLHDSAFKLRCVNPSHKVFHAPEKDTGFEEEQGNYGDKNLVTKYAGSDIVSGPTRTWPCSMNFTALIIRKEESSGLRR